MVQTERFTFGSNRMFLKSNVQFELCLKSERQKVRLLAQAKIRMFGLWTFTVLCYFVGVKQILHVWYLQYRFKFKSMDLLFRPSLNKLNSKHLNARVMNISLLRYQCNCQHWQAHKRKRERKKERKEERKKERKEKKERGKVIRLY